MYYCVTVIKLMTELRKALALRNKELRALQAITQFN